VEDVGTGRGGDVNVRADQVTVLNGGRIAVATQGAAPAGDLHLVADTLNLFDGGKISSQSTSTSPLASGGSLDIRVGDTIVMRHGLITASTLNASQGGTARGGNIDVVADQSIFMDRSQITAKAANEGGNIQLTAPLFITLRNGSQIRTDSGKSNGGNITIDPLVITLTNGSSINANGGINGGNVQINADSKPGVSTTTVTATGQTGLSGVITNNPANTDIAYVLAQLPGSLLSAEARLQPQCGPGGSFSSFLATGRGGVPFQIGFWLPDLEFPGSSQSQEPRP
jgi:hypothetical protein